MCGIAGIINFNSNSIDSRPIYSMTESIVHRGPDDSGYFNDNHVAFGFRRLSIIDILLGHQPMEDDNGNYVIVYNGEIYNFKELSSRISKFTNKIANSDTKVLIEYISTFGIKKTIDDINGMFAIAVYDKKENFLYLARDFFGKKPLYYFFDQNTFFFHLH